MRKDKKKIMHFRDDEDFETDPIGYIMTHPLVLINYILAIVAVYLSFQRNQGFSLGPFLAALVFSPFYLLYAYAMPIAQAMPVQGGYYYDY